MFVASLSCGDHKLSKKSTFQELRKQPCFKLCDNSSISGVQDLSKQPVFTIFPSMDTTMVLLSEYIWEKKLHLVSRVGSFNMKMLDHLLEIRDNPVKQQLLDLLLVILAQTFNIKKIQRECWSFPLHASLCCHTLYDVNTHVQVDIWCSFCPICEICPRFPSLQLSELICLITYRLSFTQDTLILWSYLLESVMHLFSLLFLLFLVLSMFWPFVFCK